MSISLKLLLASIAMVAVVTTGGEARAADPPTFVVITAGKTTSMSKADVRAYFAKKTTRWPDDVLVTPFDLAQNDPTRVAFSQAIYGKSPQAVLLEWRQRIFTGTGTPPREVKDDASMIAVVAATAGAIGYVHVGTHLPANVHAIAVVWED